MDGEESGTQGMDEFNLDEVTQYDEIIVTQQEVWGELWLQKLVKKSLGHQRPVAFKTIGSDRYYQLNGSSFTVGRDSTCDFKLSDQTVTKQVLTRVSKVQFEITKDVTHFLSSPVLITDRSSNGTFVNGEKLGQGKRRILMHKDKIALVSEMLVFFEFRSKMNNNTMEIPEEVSCKYFAEAKVGSGAFGLVYKAKSIRSCETYALKMISSEENIQMNSNQGQRSRTPFLIAQNEIAIMRDVCHPCIVRLIDLVQPTFGNKQTYTLVLEYMEGGDLLHRVIDSQRKRLTEDETRFIFFQMTHAIKYLHSRKIIHRDIKPENILLKDNGPWPLAKLTDFGLSKIIAKETLIKSLLGTPCYVAPEVLTAHERGSYDHRIDIWSLGVVLFATLSGTLPFAEEYAGSIDVQIKKGRYTFSSACWDNISITVKNLIIVMLKVDPDERISLSEMLSHEWLSRNHPDLVRARKMMEDELTKMCEEEKVKDENNIQQISKRIRRI